jgi:hypothetical protein
MTLSGIENCLVARHINQLRHRLFPASAVVFKFYLSAT